MIVYTGGTFDLPHIGHVNFFRQCKKFFPNGYLVVSLNTDEFVKSYKGFTPLFSYEERHKLLSTVEYIDEIIPNEGGADSRLSILKSNADVVVIGNDWLSKDYCKQMGFTPQWLTDHGIALCYLPHTDGISSSMLKERLNGSK